MIEPSLHERLPGSSAVAAAVAARVALVHGGFPLFHALLLASRGHEDADGFIADRLPAVAVHVPGLRSTAFDSEARTLYWEPWVDGRRSRPGAHPELLDDPSALQRYVENAANCGE
ncbi:hypothetical protein [Streptacidiphilus neutrinimicus]|uniref:hypothetical protein n=1 Tax=Streptacidiphilus neutrinimicus TaxID=105420 RepID=UPI001378A05F|nr:hypothetical protein [Streptacidiphilus neutrinimicus]